MTVTCDLSAIPHEVDVLVTHPILNEGSNVLNGEPLVVGVGRTQIPEEPLLLQERSGSIPSDSGRQ